MSVTGIPTESNSKVSASRDTYAHNSTPTHVHNAISANRTPIRRAVHGTPFQEAKIMPLSTATFALEANDCELHSMSESIDTSLVQPASMWDSSAASSPRSQVSMYTSISAATTPSATTSQLSNINSVLTSNSTCKSSGRARHGVVSLPNTTFTEEPDLKGEIVPLTLARAHGINPSGASASISFKKRTQNVDEQSNRDYTSPIESEHALFDDSKSETASAHNSDDVWSLSAESSFVLEQVSHTLTALHSSDSSDTTVSSPARANDMELRHKDKSPNKPVSTLANATVASSSCSTSSSATKTRAASKCVYDRFQVVAQTPRTRHEKKSNNVNSDLRTAHSATTVSTTSSLNSACEVLAPSAIIANLHAPTLAVHSKIPRGASDLHEYNCIDRVTSTSSMNSAHFGVLDSPTFVRRAHKFRRALRASTSYEHLHFNANASFVPARKVTYKHFGAIADTSHNTNKRRIHSYTRADSNMDSTSDTDSNSDSESEVDTDADSVSATETDSNSATESVPITQAHFKNTTPHDNRAATLVVLPPVRNKHPKSVADCSALLKDWNRKYDGPITVQSGAHSYLTPHDYANRHTRVPRVTVLHTDQLNADLFELDTKNMCVTVSAGCSLGNLYKRLIARDYICVGGMCPEVCVGGFICGGGLGLLMRLHSTGADNLVRATVVKADGSVCKLDFAQQGASREENELMYLLRGGAQGVVLLCTVTLRVYKLPAKTWDAKYTLKPWTSERHAEVLATCLTDAFSASTPKYVAMQFNHSEESLEIRMHCHHEKRWTGLCGKYVSTDGTGTEYKHGRADWTSWFEVEWHERTNYEQVVEWWADDKKWPPNPPYAQFTRKSSVQYQSLTDAQLEQLLHYFTAARHQGACPAAPDTEYWQPAQRDIDHDGTFWSLTHEGSIVRFCHPNVQPRRTATRAVDTESECTSSESEIVPLRSSRHTRPTANEYARQFKYTKMATKHTRARTRGHIGGDNATKRALQLDIPFKPLQLNLWIMLMGGALKTSKWRKSAAFPHYKALAVWQYYVISSPAEKLTAEAWIADAEACVQASMRGAYVSFAHPAHGLDDYFLKNASKVHKLTEKYNYSHKFVQLYNCDIRPLLDQLDTDSSDEEEDDYSR